MIMSLRGRYINTDPSLKYFGIPTISLSTVPAGLLVLLLLSFPIGPRLGPGWASLVSKQETAAVAPSMVRMFVYSRQYIRFATDPVRVGQSEGLVGYLRRAVPRPHAHLNI